MTRKSLIQSISTIKKLRLLQVFTSAEAERFGLSRASLSRMAKQDELIRLASGVYCFSDQELEGRDRDYNVACLRCGKDSIIGGMTALFHYGLIEEVPNHIWLMVSKTTRSPAPLYRVIRTAHDPKVGVISFQRYSIATIERAILEGLSYASKIGEEIAISAARKALRSGDVDRKKLYAIAKKMKLVKTIEKYWGAISSQ
ncbi:MAG: type IV toxin-antitoxin system AbiEi family antitoxin domain-containing protein [Proteobacteria bacterium]|nr:type IV toxin-antitoxin system AbiEi family antitoxin domain-containing protein [Pseudomonadota bacterium]